MCVTMRVCIHVCVCSAMPAPPANLHQPQKKRNPRLKKPTKLGSPEVALPLPDGVGGGGGGGGRGKDRERCV